MSIDVNVQNDLVIVTETTEDIVVNVSNAAGPQGPAGPAGQGVPVGGTTNQVLKKLSNTNYDTYWALDAGGVPYSGATGNVDLGEYELKAGQFELDTTPTGTASVAVTRWNDTNGVSETTLKGGNVVLKNGIDLVARVVNKVTPNATLTKAAYQAVRVSGAQGQRLAVALAQANNDANSADTIGLVTETIATNQEGFIMTVGQLENINTTGSLQGETWVDGDVLYLSPTTAGAITKVKPTGNGHIVVIGYVEYAHANNGKIYVKVMNGWELDELHDVAIVTPANNEALIYESSTSLWKNKTIATALGFTPVTSARLINTTSPLVGGGDLSADRTLSIPAATTSVNGYLTSTDWNTFNGKQASGNYITALTGEVTASGPGSTSATLLNSAVIGKLLTGLNLAGGGTIAATDTILQAFGKTQNQISALVGGVMYEGVWNASTNSPAIVSSVGSKGDYYVVNVAGSTNIDGITDWKVGDWIIYNGTTWDKVDNTDAVSSVNGFTGAVSLTTANISEVTNLYYTEGRVSANTDVAANTAARHNAVTIGTANGLSLSTQALSLALASGSTTGALSSTDWTTFNNKQNTITNPVTGTGTTNYLPKWTSGTAIGNSLLQEGTNAIGLGVTSSAWGSTYKVLQFPGGYVGADSTLVMGLGQNFYWNGSANIYVNNGFASDYYLYLGQHVWRTAASGTAGGTIAFTQAMTLTAGGNLQLGTTSGGNWRFLCYQNASTGSATSSAFMARQDGTDDIAQFWGGGSVLATIKNNGNFLLGSTVDSGERLQVSGSVLATSFIKSGGTSSQYLMADGSVTTGGGGGSVDELQVALISQVYG
jgi:nitrogen fixation protein